MEKMMIHFYEDCRIDRVSANVKKIINVNHARSNFIDQPSL